MIKLGLCKGEHDIKGVTDYIFPPMFFMNSEDMFDYDRMQQQIQKVFKDFSIYEDIGIYVTGYTPALIEVINYCFRYDFIYVYLYHFNQAIGDYEVQELFKYYL